MRSAVLWLVDANAVSDADAAALSACLSDAEMSRYQRFVRRVRQREFLLGRVLLRFAASRAVGIAFDAIDIVERPGLAPLLQFPMAFPLSVEREFAFSLSHSRGWVACATSLDTPLGLDIEALDASRDIDAVGLAAFSAGESSWLSNLPEADKVAAFYGLWSDKEALYKLMSHTGERPELPELVMGSVRQTSGPGWQAQACALPDFAVSLCSRHPLASIEQIHLQATTPSAWSRQLGDA
ncbi:4'-phosphopantetheinyl transferase superfamily protein [Collimonas arenae]|uniref:4'-phosphopantetheinyl transferase superfamily protein n=1 Tax=Collimonas arenae TaxID=279058 RepID=A0A127PSK6_9BURK|nr:4'-phosphopantetheinyl transferase superfamily protein [Collimonas arenae]AMP00362.1 4'-phosphopantetheinyl transferase superfamily protein [Collimonas arenae]AMP10241.1 4'-phosphopantetheinyl transferase superfamily protein [Collimonas arenae]